MGRKTRSVVAALGVSALGVAGLLSYAPDRVPPIIATYLTAVENVVSQQQSLLGVAGILLAYSLWRHLAGHSPTPPAPMTPDHAASDDLGAQAVGAAYTTTVADAKATIADAEQMDETAVVTPLRTALIDLLVARGWPREQATAHVETGAWTENRTLAVFLGTEQAGDYAFLYRVYAWLLPERAFTRRVHAAIEAITEYAASDRSWEQPADTTPPTAADSAADAESVPAVSATTTEAEPAASPTGGERG